MTEQKALKDMSEVEIKAVLWEMEQQIKNLTQQSQAGITELQQRFAEAQKAKAPEESK